MGYVPVSVTGFCGPYQGAENMGLRSCNHRGFSVPLGNLQREHPLSILMLVTVALTTQLREEGRGGVAQSASEFR